MRALLVLAAAFAAGFLVRRATPEADACPAPLDVTVTYDLTLTQHDGIDLPETATLDTPQKRITFADGTAAVFE